MSIWNTVEQWCDEPPAVRITLGEGNTPLVASRRLGTSSGLDRLFFKLESGNPTGSYKDRFAAAAVSHMVASGKTRAISTSSGNTGAALAAYCAAAGIGCEIAVVETAPAEKLFQMQAYGANIYRVRGFGLDAGITRRTLLRLEEWAQAPDAELQISAFSFSPAGMNGVRSLACELAEQLAGGMDHVFCQAGGGGLTLAVAQGFARLAAGGQLAILPRVECAQPEGNATIAGPLQRGDERAVDVKCTTTVSGLQVASVIDGNETLQAVRASGGTGHTVSDEEVWHAQQRLAREEGIFAEPAGAVTVAATLKAARDGYLRRDATVVCLITGTGFKDQHSVARMAGQSDWPLLEPESLGR